MSFKLFNNYVIRFVGKIGKPLCFINNDLLVYKEGKFSLFNIHKKSIITSSIINIKKYNYIGKSRLLTRLLRLEPRFALMIDSESFLYPLKGYLYSANIVTREIIQVHKFRVGMSAPLQMMKIEKLEGFEDQFIYGDYFRNKEKQEVSIYSSNDGINDWYKKYTFKSGEINHIHAIIPDQLSKKVWILTGDFGDSAGIWFTTDDFKTVKKLFSGEQDFRSCVAYPNEEGLLYLTDTPVKDNSIFLIKDDEIIKLKDLSGSVIYGTEYHNSYLFSTVVEGKSSENDGLLSLFSTKRGIGIKTSHCDLILGNLKEGFIKIATAKKDMFPFGLMQFGTFQFPYGINNSNHIVVYATALKKIDGKTIILKKED